MARDRPALLRRGLALEYVTLGWNVVGVLVVIAAALAARSVALAGFGLDSGVEIFASVVVVWEPTGVVDPARQGRALRLIGVAFVVLAVYIGVQGLYVLATRARPDTSPVGIAWTALTCAVMLALVDAYLAGAVLVGLATRAALGWWWADALAGFVIVAYGVKEGRAARRASATPGRLRPASGPPGPDCPTGGTLKDLRKLREP